MSETNEKRQKIEEKKKYCETITHILNEGVKSFHPISQLELSLKKQNWKYQNLNPPSSVPEVLSRRIKNLENILELKERLNEIMDLFFKTKLRRTSMNKAFEFVSNAKSQRLRFHNP